MGIYYQCVNLAGLESIKTMNAEVGGPNKTSLQKFVIILNKGVLSFLLPEKNGCASRHSELAFEGMALRFYHDFW